MTEAIDFLRLWHQPESLITLTLLQPGARGRVAVLCEEVSTFTEMLDADGLTQLVNLHGVRWNVYHSAGVLKARPPTGKRGGKKLVESVPGVWLDLDVREGGLASYEVAWQLSFSLGIAPTLVVGTGSGGLHAYWKTDVPLSPAEGEELGQALHAHAERVSGVELDHVANPDRILRLPGSVRWPKADEPEALCTLLYRDGPLWPAARIREVVWPAWVERTAERAAVRARVLGSTLEARHAAADGNGWAHLLRLAELEQRFNVETTWDEILLPHGWVYVHSDSDGRRVWNLPRPGNHSGRTATTDWPGSPDVMSLLTRDPSCGLVELRDAGVGLSKYRVHCQLQYAGDEAAMVRELLRES